jgi:hypothetical protein
LLLADHRLAWWRQVDVDVDPAGEDELSARVKLSSAAHLAAELDDPASGDAHVRDPRSTGRDNSASTDDEIDRH